MKTILAWTLVVLFAVWFTGCAPMQGYLNGKFPLLGDDPANALQQMETIAKNVAIVYDPTITDAEFDEWVARQNYEIRRFQALLELYQTFVPQSELDATIELQETVNKAEQDLQEAVRSRG